MMIDLEPNSGQGGTLSERRVWLAAGLLLALHAFLCWQSRELGVLLMRDDARYLILGTSLGQGGYHDLFLDNAAAHSLYPPALPALLFTWGSIIGDSFDSFIVMNILLSVSALALVFASVKRIWGSPIALACLVPLSVSPLLVLRAGGLRSETAYMFFSFVALWALLRARPVTQTLVLAGLAAIVATLTRTVGITLIGAIMILWLYQRRFRAAGLLALGSLLTVGAWIVWMVVAPQQHAGSNYIGDIVAATGDYPSWGEVLWRRTGIRLGRYFGRTLPWSLPVPTVPGTPIDNLIGSLAVIVGLLAGLLVMLKRWRIAGLYLILYAGALMGYPFMRARFLEPVLPLLIVTLFVGVGALVSKFRPAWAMRAIVIASVVFTVSGAVRLAPRIERQLSCGPFDLAAPPSCLTVQQSSFLRSADYISRHTDPEDLFITKMPETLYYYTGRRSVAAEVALTTRPDAFLGYLADRGTEWALLTAGSARLGSILRVNCSDIEVEKIFHRRTVLFRLPSTTPQRTDGPDVQAADACAALDDYLRDYKLDDQGMAIE